jgi:hypothetical protein
MDTTTLEKKAVLLLCDRAFRAFKKYGILYVEQNYPQCVELVLSQKEKSIPEAIRYFQNQIDRIN